MRNGGSFHRWASPFSPFSPLAKGDNFRLFLHQQTDKQQTSVCTIANGKLKEIPIVSIIDKKNSLPSVIIDPVNVLLTIGAHLRFLPFLEVTLSVYLFNINV
jgi:hypothetical protein